jgi:menaquinol-cytochrome c reductase iron-sulfur subunit
MMLRRDFYRLGTVVLGSLMGVVLAVPGAAYVLDPLRRRLKASEFQDLARLSDLTPGVPQAFPILAERQDAWVKYPREPMGTVWLIRQAAEAEPSVVAFTAECPHLGCSVNLAADAKSFLCPCHTSAFTFEGKPLNAVPPRGMDALEVELSTGSDPMVRVKFQRFRTMSKEKTPLV